MYELMKINFHGSFDVKLINYINLFLFFKF